jgi:hypothetical protein
MTLILLFYLIKKKLERHRIDSFADTYIKNFNEFDIEKSSSELRDLIALCEIKGPDLVSFISKIKKELGKKRISLDFLET